MRKEHWVVIGLVSTIVTVGCMILAFIAFMGAIWSSNIFWPRLLLTMIIFGGIGAGLAVKSQKEMQKITRKKRLQDLCGFGAPDKKEAPPFTPDA